MSLYVVSDIHIQGENDPNLKSLINLMTTRAKPKDVIVLAGDIFDIFVGKKEFFLKIYKKFFEAIKVAENNNVVIHYIEGNHDFLLEKNFKNHSNLKLHSQDLTLELGEKKFFIAHGDLANKKDFGYIILRKILRSQLMKLILLVLPGEVIYKLGRYLSNKSEANKKKKGHYLETQIRKIYRTYAKGIMSQGYDYVILGHCHDLDQFEYDENKNYRQYINVGYPPTHKKLLYWSLNSQKINRIDF